MKILRTLICAALLVAGLSGCEKLIPEIDLANNLEGSWEKVYPEGVQDAGLVIWTFSSINKESQDPFILTIYVSDVLDHDFKQEDRKAAYTPAVGYWVKECSKDRLVLERFEENVDGPNLLEGDVTFRRMGLYTK